MSRRKFNVGDRVELVPSVMYNRHWQTVCTKGLSGVISNNGKRDYYINGYYYVFLDKKMPGLRFYDNETNLMMVKTRDLRPFSGYIVELL